MPSLLMVTFNWILSSLIDELLRPFRGVNPLWPLLVLSIFTGALLLIVFRYTSDQRGIQECKDRIKGHLLEIRLFKDDLGILLSAQWMILKYNLRYMSYGLKPLLVMILPVAAMLIQLEGWFGSRPLKPGESTLVTVCLAGGAFDPLPSIELEADDGLIIESPSLRIPANREVDWKIRAEKPGRHHLLVKLGGTRIHKTVTVSPEEFTRVSSVKPSFGIWDVALHPGERPVPRDGPVKEIHLEYPSRSIEFLGWKLHWLLVFFVISTLTGFLFKGVFKVEI